MDLSPLDAGREMENKMAYVIRSMSTTDARPGVSPQPFHCYLLPREERSGAWWGTGFRAMTFDTIEEAEAEWHRCWPNGAGYGTKDIAPVGCECPIWVAKHYVPA